MYKYSESLSNTLYIEIKQMIKEFPSDKINVTKYALFFLFRELQLITVLLLICDSYVNLKRKVHLSKSLFGIFHFRFRLVLIKVYNFVQQKAWTL